MVKKDIVDWPKDKSNEDEEERCCNGQKGAKPVKKRDWRIFTLAYLAVQVMS